MSTIKVDTYLTRGGASEIAIDKLKGASSASSISVVAEGGTNTTNLQQGLAKVWFNIDQEPSTQTFRDSFNVASSSDEGTGVTKLTFTNAFNNDGYSAAGMAKDDSGGSFGILRISSPMSTTQFQFMGESHDDTNVDCVVAAGSLHGDLA